MKNIGNEIKILLLNRKLKQKEIAEKLNMTPVNFSKILRKESIDTGLLGKIADVLEIPISAFFEVSGEHSGKVEEPLPAYRAKETKKCSNCKSLEKIIEYQNRHIERLENELEQYRKKNVL